MLSGNKVRVLTYSYTITVSDRLIDEKKVEGQWKYVHIILFMFGNEHVGNEHTLSSSMLLERVAIGTYYNAKS